MRAEIAALVRTYWRWLRGRCLTCGDLTLSMPRVMGDGEISTGWCRRHHPAWNGGREAALLTAGARAPR